MSQKDTVLAMLRTRDEGVCGDQFLANYLYTYRNRVGELRDEGYDIATIKCPYRPAHTHTKQLATYRLYEPPRASLRPTLFDDEVGYRLPVHNDPTIGNR